MTHATDIVAYTYKAEMLCPSCTLVAVSGNSTAAVEFDFNTDAIDAWLRTTAAERGIDVDDERSFDSGDFPKVVFASMIEPCGDCDFCHGSDAAVGCADELCHGCGEPLV